MTNAKAYVTSYLKFSKMIQINEWNRAVQSSSHNDITLQVSSKIFLLFAALQDRIILLAENLLVQVQHIENKWNKHSIA